MNRMIAALTACAAAHRFNLLTGRDNEGQYALITGLNIPTLADVRSIVEGFTGSHAAVETNEDWGYITVWLDKTPILDDKDIDYMSINMALPYKG